MNTTAESSLPNGELVARNEKDRVPFRAKCAYGAAGCVDSLQQINYTMVQPIFVVLLGVSPALMSAVALSFRLWDAFIDPYIGMRSDNTRSRWGRRKPFIIFGALATGLWFPMLWLIGPGWSQTAILYWYIFAMFLNATFHSLWGVPYQTMQLEMTPDYKERTSVMAFRSFFQKIASMGISWVWFLTQLPIFYTAAGKPDALTGIRVIAVAGGAMIIVFGLLPVFFVKERLYEKAASQPKIPMRESMKLTLSNRPFLILSGCALLMMTGTSIVSSMNFYIGLFHVFGGDTVRWSTILGINGTVTLVAGLAGIPIFQGIANRLGKTKTLGITISLVMLGSLASWFTMTPAHPYWSFVGGILNAPGYTGLWMLLPSMLADVADHDELKTSERREGSFSSIFGWLLKLSSTLGLSVSGPLIVLAGFQARGTGAIPPPEVLLNLRMLNAFLPSVFLIGSIVLLARYPLSATAMAEIRAKLEARRGTA